VHHDLVLGEQREVRARFGTGRADGEILAWEDVDGQRVRICGHEGVSAFLTSWSIRVSFRSIAGVSTNG
jgi:hypothetical protein